MKLALFDDWRLGVVDTEVATITDVTAAVPGAQERDPLGARWWVRMCRDFDSVRPAIAAAYKTTPPRPLSQVRLRAPALNPGKILAIASNYGDHVIKMRDVVLERVAGRADECLLEFDVFLKSTSSIVGPDDPVVLPVDPVEQGHEVHHESELAVVIGRGGTSIPEPDALDHVLGYTIALDITVRGDGDRSRRKSHDTFTPMDPWIVTSDEIGDPHRLDVRLDIDGQPRQRVGTGDLLVGVAGIVSYSSSVILTGAPPGVGAVHAGEVIATEISGIGTMRNAVVMGSKIDVGVEVVVTRAEPDVGGALDAFYSDLALVDLQPLWTQTKQLMPAMPSPAAAPWLWQGTRLRALAERARDLITIERGGERRVLALANPGLGGAPFATSTLWGAIQVLGPNESAPAHRHTAAAIRFVLEGDGVWTTVDGDACRMAAGDLVLTPAWTFHDHTNGGDAPMLWFDGLDLPLADALDAIFYENHPEVNQPVIGFDGSAERYQGGRVPYGEAKASTPATPHSPLLVFRWAQSDVMLRTMLTGVDDPMASIEFVSPTTGTAALPTMTCVLHRVRADSRTRPTRKVGSSIFVVYRGTGRSVIGGTTFEWAAGDMFVVPSWVAVDHEAADESDLFEVSDEVVMRSLHLFREETFEEPQVVTGTFCPKGVIET